MFIHVLNALFLYHQNTTHNSYLTVARILFIRFEMKLMILSLASEVMFLFDALIVFVVFLCRFHYRAGRHEQQDERGFTYQI